MMMKAQFVPAWQSGSRALGVDQLHLNPEHGLTKPHHWGFFVSIWAEPTPNPHD